MIVEIDGEHITSDVNFHRAISKAFDLSSYYGNNLDALWDALSTDIERPVLLIWNNSSISKNAMPADFDRIIKVLRRVEFQDAQWNLPEEERFILKLN
ncbi:barstar family protein [Leeia aquatica]|uniref:Barnase inhibitor n=1 Tax=Leeia aquatica TaxID=2725557 RepID=A0A847SDF3_9NEIS|nr:barstar family protein [Leeia aquatica]NLR76975.1 barnase inhibitor [Leeia aquatica]